jgi:REP element-mobilizing transposase RayT
MPVQQTIPFEEGTFFITFTCHKWMNLIETTDSYDLVYKWMDHLKSKGHKIIGYVIMPNHVHVLIDFIKTHQSINTIVCNGKRFMAYDIIKRLKAKGQNLVLSTLSKNVEAKRKANNKQHEVWELSFDWKYCNSYKFVKQKLDYVHNNPCSGKWNLCESPVDYLHSSAKYYAGEPGNYAIDMIEEK